MMPVNEKVVTGEAALASRRSPWAEGRRRGCSQGSSGRPLPRAIDSHGLDWEKQKEKEGGWGDMIKEIRFEWGLGTSEATHVLLKFECARLEHQLDASERPPSLTSPMLTIIHYPPRSYPLS